MTGDLLKTFSELNRETHENNTRAADRTSESGTLTKDCGNLVEHLRAWTLCSAGVEHLYLHDPAARR